MMKLEIFDPPMCCSTGVCGLDVDPMLPRFAADLEWLKSQGVSVARYNLAQEPAIFVANAVVNAALQQDGNTCLPLVMVNGEIVSRAIYPEKAVLARYAGIAVTARTFAALPIQSCCSTVKEKEIGCC